MTDNLRVLPVQERAKKQLLSIQEAATSVINEKGRDRFTTNDVAEKAGCSIGTVYRYFPDRVALLDAVLPDRDAAAEKLQKIKNYVEACEAFGDEPDLDDLLEFVK